MIIFQSYDRLLCLLNPKVNHQRYERTNGGLSHWIYHMRYGKSAFKVEIYRRTYWTMFLSDMIYMLDCQRVAACSSINSSRGDSMAWFSK